jgi:hypothetical protein
MINKDQMDMIFPEFGSVARHNIPKKFGSVVAVYDQLFLSHFPMVSAPALG